MRMNELVWKLSRTPLVVHCAAPPNVMCDVNQQNEALKNVAYGADTTWTSDLCLYQRANMNLHMRSRQLKLRTSTWTRLTPRTVRDSIPQSRLARYSNYEYDKARELSYAPMVMRLERLNEQYEPRERTEPWMLPEIDDLYAGFLSYNPLDDETIWLETHNVLPCPKDQFEISYESPFLEARTFDEMALKLKIVASNVKELWNSKYYPYYGWHPVGKSKQLMMYKSPACQMFSAVKEETKPQEQSWLRNLGDSDKTMAEIKVLAKNFKEQNTWIFKKESRSWLEASHVDSADLPVNRRLYSAVLQGSSAQKSLQSMLDVPKKSDTATETSEVSGYASYMRSVGLSTTTEPSLHVNPRQVYQQPYFTLRSPVQTTQSAITPITSVYASPTNYNYQYFNQFPNTTTYLNPRLYSNNFIPNTSVLNLRQTNYFPLLLPNAAPYAPAQTPYYQNLPRGGAYHQSYRTMVFPHQRAPPVVLPSPSSSGWYLQPSVKLAQPVLPPRPPIHQTYHYNNFNKPSTSRQKPSSVKPAPKEEEQMDSIVAKTVNAVLDDPEDFVPITGVPSDELELQALEQYIPSSTNVFQELERQAAEQYEATTGSENCKSPPKCLDGDDVLVFGGWLETPASVLVVLRLGLGVGRVGLGSSNIIMYKGEVARAAS